MVDPSSIMTASTRRARSSVPTRARARSEATVSLLLQTPAEDAAEKDQDDSDEDSPERLTMSPAEIRVIRRLSERANVLPVIARADSLTDDKLEAVKDAVRKDLQDAGLDFGLFGPAKTQVDETARRPNGHANGNVNGHEELNGVAEVAEDSDEEEEEDERPSRPVIKLRPARHSTRASRSRSRRDLKSAADNGGSPRDVDRESIANVRFSAHIVSKTDLSTLLPFALIAPEHASKRKQVKVRPVSTDSRVSNYSTAVEELTEDGHGTSVQSALSPSSVSGRNTAYLHGPPADLKGVFTRKFRWGTVDVLDPNHCDFAALRTAVLSTHLKVRVRGCVPCRCILIERTHRSSRLVPERFCMRSTGQRSSWRGVLHAVSTRRKQNECWKVSSSSPFGFRRSLPCRYC
jgi:hypothetical protein